MSKTQQKKSFFFLPLVLAHSEEVRHLHSHMQQMTKRHIEADINVLPTQKNIRCFKVNKHCQGICGTVSVAIHRRNFKRV